MTANDNAIAAIARSEWRRREETLVFKAELQKDLEDCLKSLVAKGTTPGVTLDELIRLAAKAKQLKEILERL